MVWWQVNFQQKMLITIKKNTCIPRFLKVVALTMEVDAIYKCSTIDTIHKQ